jgi:hypothetical protein
LSNREVDDVFHGECLCGAVVFEVRPSFQYGPARAIGLCHCTSCQRWSGASALPFVVAVPERFRVARGQEFMAHYRDDESTVRTFCRRCGSCLYQDLGTTYYVSAGVLRDLTLQPTFAIQPEQR